MNKDGLDYSVMTLNLRFGLADDGPNNWEYRKETLPHLFDRYRPDFVCFQEVNTFQLAYLREVLPEYEWIGERSPCPDTWQHIVIFYKANFRVLYNDRFFLSVTPDVPSRLKKSQWPRQCTVGMFEKNNQRLICINTHFDFDAGVRLTSAGIIMERIAGLPNDVPALLCGDFNAGPEDPCFKLFAGQGKNPEGVNHVYFKSSFNKPYPGTHHGFTGDTHGDHIDWILFRGDLTVTESRVVSDTFGGYYPSDHFPVYARLVRNVSNTSDRHF